MFVGVLLLVLGILMILDRMNIIYGDVWDYFLPVAIIALGASMIFNSKRNREH